MSGARIWRASARPRPVRRTGGEARDLLRSGSRPPSVHLYPRSDGPGSSQDLPQFAAMGGRLPCAEVELCDPEWRWSRGCLRTPGACIDGEPITYRAVLASSEDVIEYYSPDFHSEPVRSIDVVAGRPELFVNNILRQFGLAGVRIEAEPMPAVYRGTGLGGSNLAHAAALILASALSGVDLSLGEIYVYATFLENTFGVSSRGDDDHRLDFGVSLTGGQEALTALQGGFWDNVHLPAFYGPFSVASRQLVSPDRYPEAAQHLLLVNIGRRRAPGVTSSGINNAWMARWRTGEGALLHLQKAEIAYRAAEGLRLGDWPAYVTAVREYRELREQLCADYTSGQEELARLCRQHDAEYFPLGAGAGTCLVAAADAATIEAIGTVVRKSADETTGRVVLPFNVRERGLEMEGFSEIGLRIPRGAEAVN